MDTIDRKKDVAELTNDQAANSALTQHYRATQSYDRYQDVVDLLKHYHNMRFKQLTLFLAISGLLLTTVVDKSYALPVEAALRVMGILVVLTFYVWEKRCAQYWYALRDRAVRIEKGEGETPIFSETLVAKGLLSLPEGPSAIIAEIFFVINLILWISSYWILPW